MRESEQKDEIRYCHKQKESKTAFKSGHALQRNSIFKLQSLILLAHEIEIENDPNQ